MATRTIIRVKRRLEDDPVDAIVVSYKRKRTDAISDDEKSAVLKFTGTVENKDDDVTTKVKRINKSELTKSFKIHASEIQSKNRALKVYKSKENRFKVLSLNRTECPEQSDDATTAADVVTIVDVDVDVQSDEEIVDNSVKTEPKYVYDLYFHEFMEYGDVNDSYIDHVLSVQPLQNELQYCGSEDSEEIDPYEEDSNDEGNWRNDYPDSDNSINDDDMMLANSLYGMGIDNGIDLSSDSDDERYLHMSGMTRKHGYAEYMARAKRELSVSSLDDSN